MKYTFSNHQLSYQVLDPRAYYPAAFDHHLSQVTILGYARKVGTVDLLYRLDSDDLWFDDNYNDQLEVPFTQDDLKV